MTNFHEPVSKFYNMQPGVDEIALSGYDLCDGMIVLIEDDMMRESNDEDRTNAGYEGERDAYAQQRLIENNRWALVTRFEEVREYNQIKFVALYADGTKKVRKYGEGHEWYFKLNCTRTDALIVSEQEWEEMNYRGAGLTKEQFEALSPTDQEAVFAEDRLEHQDNRPYEITEYIPIFRAQVAYLMCGDFTGEKWCNEVMGYHLNEGDIVGFEHLSTVIGAWGMSSVVFTFDVELKDDKASWTNVKSAIEDKIPHMVGDSDYTLIDVGILNPPPTPSDD